MFPFGSLLLGEGAVYEAVAPDISSTSPNGDETDAELLYDSDGGVRTRQETVAQTPFYQGKDPWSSIHPNESGGANWSMRVKHVSGTDVHVGGDSLNTWLTLDSDRQWVFRANGGGGFQQVTGVYSVELSRDGGSTVYDGPNELTVTLTEETP